MGSRILEILLQPFLYMPIKGRQGVLARRSAAPNAVADRVVVEEGLDVEEQVDFLHGLPEI